MRGYPPGTGLERFCADCGPRAAFPGSVASPVRRCHRRWHCFPGTGKTFHPFFREKLRPRPVTAGRSLPLAAGPATASPPCPAARVRPDADGECGQAADPVGGRPGRLARIPAPVPHAAIVPARHRSVEAGSGPALRALFPREGPFARRAATTMVAVPAGRFHRPASGTPDFERIRTATRAGSFQVQAMSNFRHRCRTTPASGTRKHGAGAREQPARAGAAPSRRSQNRVPTGTGRCWPPCRCSARNPRPSCPSPGSGCRCEVGR